AIASSRIDSSSLANASRSASLVTLPDRMASSRARCRRSSKVWSLLSASDVQRRPSLALRPAWSEAACSPRSDMERFIAEGSSDGLWIRLPDPSELCAWASCSSRLCRRWSAWWLIACWVILISSPSDEAGACDQLVEQLVDGRHDPG